MAKAKARSNPYIARRIAGKARAARKTNCPRCGKQVLRGDCDDIMSWVVSVDTSPLTPLEEVVAELTGHAVYNLIPAEMGTEIHSRSATGLVSRYPVVLGHECPDANA